MFERIKKHYALKAYVKKLGPLLQKRYGKSEFYTPGQVYTTSRIVGLNEKYVFYGYALFCMQSAFNQELSESTLDYNAMRQELADKFFDGENSFNTSDAINKGYEMDWGSSNENMDGSTISTTGLDN